VRIADLAVQWGPDWLTAAVLAGLTIAYVRARLRLRTAGRHWPRSRDAAFTVGIGLAIWVTCGFPQARGSQLMWVWTMQVLLLLLVVPTVLVAAQPVALARSAHGPRALLLRLLESRAARWGGHPALSLLYVPIICGLLFFGGVAGLTLTSPEAGWALHVLLLALGCVIALPLLDVEDGRSSLAVGLTVALGAIELLIDAFPGIVLRLETHLEIPHFALHRPSWSPSWLADQQTAGGILWTVAELLDLPFLILVTLQWIRVERREATRIDAELDRTHRTSTSSDQESDPTATTPPWWLDDPAMRNRYGRGRG
jgi:putative copper resistance protein D